MHGRFDGPVPVGYAQQEVAIGGEPEGGFDPKKLWGIFLRRWMVIAGALAIAILWAVIWLAQVAPRYTATAELLLDPRRLNVSPGAAVFNDFGFSKSGMATELALVRSHSVAQRVVAQLGLAKDPDFASFSQSGGLMSSLSSIVNSVFSGEAPAAETGRSGGADGEGRFSVSRISAPSLAERIAVARVRGGIGVRRSGPTYFIRISYTHTNPAKAALVANGVADAYLDEQLEARFQGAKRGATWLSERVVTVRQQLEVSERAAAQHRAKYRLVGATGGTLSQQQATAINSQLVAARAVAVEKKAKYDQARKVLKSGKLATVAVVMQSPAITGLRQQDLDLRRQEADLLTRYGTEHPKIVKIRADRRDLKREVRRQLAQVVETLKTDYEFALKKERSLEASLGQLTGISGSSSGAEIRLRELLREVEANKALYGSLLSRFKEAEQQSSLPTGQSRVTTPAVRPHAPSYPNTRRILILAILGGLALGFAGAFALEYIESGFLTIEQVDKTLGLPVLAIVPQLPESKRTIKGKVVTLPDYVSLKPLSSFGESIRSARVSVQMSDIDNPPRLVMATSAVPAEGKTTIAMCLAYSLAASNKKVLLIDCDLRHPALTSHFGLGDRPGLTDLLTGRAPAEQVFVQGALPSLTIIPAGTTTRHPPDVLGSDRLREFLKLVRGSHDLVMIDAPPVTPVIDSALLSRIVEKVVFVVQWRSTPRDIVARAVNSIDNPREKIAGIILNNAQTNKLSSYSTYYNYYHKRYQKYYVE